VEASLSESESSDKFKSWAPGLCICTGETSDPESDGADSESDGEAGALGEGAAGSESGRRVSDSESCSDRASLAISKTGVHGGVDLG
jgi:hypothetical protein